MRQLQCFGAMAIAALTACSGHALAQGTFTDVIVGDLMDVSNFTNNGAIGGKRAYSVGTTSCNIGTQRLTWIDEGTSVLYPVISQNMFRLNNGRFEQVGQAWLKHGFCALNGNVCSSCPQQSNPPCAYLMPGCSDPYTSGLNGDQGGLGPKHEVNPSTGAFPPNALVGTASGNGTLRGRLIVNDADLTTAGPTANALFFVSSIYIHPEDPLFNTDNNNSSYRRITVSQANKAISLTDTTRRQLPPIYAWRDYGGGISGGQPVADPTVIITPIDIPSDGRLIVGSKAIPLGNGQYRYEYAVQNLNSDRGSDGFSVPLPPNAIVTNAGFKDVEYHSGEVQQGDDWTINVSSNAVTWTMPDNYADPRQENVLRWDTIYNFWFETNVAPAGGDVTVELFRDAAPLNATATANIPSPTGVGQPFNNNCASALPMASGGSVVDTMGATTDGGDACNEGGAGAQILNDVWYTYTSACAGDYTFSMCSASFDAKMAIYTTCGAPAPLACSDNFEECGTNGPRLTLAAAQNTTYLVRIGSSPANPAGGSGTVVVDLPNCNGIPNDDCSEALFLADGVTRTGTTVGALVSGAPGTCNGNASPDVWFSYRPSVSGFVRFDTCGSNYDTVLTAYSGCGTTQLACNDDRSELTAPLCQVNSQGPNTSSLRVNLTAGLTYLVRLSGFGSASGPYSMVVNGGQGVLPPSNDVCANRSAIGTGTFNFNTTSAGTEQAVSPTFGQIFNDVWFNKPITASGTLTIDTCGTTAFDSKIAIYESGNCSNLESKLVGFSDAAACGATASSVTIPVEPGVYVIRIGSSVANQMGAGQVNVSFTQNLVCDSIDFNNDGGQFDPIDIDAFLSVFSEGPCIPATATCNDIDFNNDGGQFDPRDIDAFLSVFSEGPCL